MIQNYERMIAMLDDQSVSEVARMSAQVAARREAIGIAAREALLATGEFEAVDTALGIMHDGREVLDVGGQAIALRLDVHVERRRLALELAQKREVERREREKDPETKSVVGTETLSAIVCPRCGDALQHAAVCPKCAAGKLGYRHRYTCVCGGADLVSKDAL